MVTRRPHPARTTATPAALNSLIALWGFVDDTTFLTKAGAVGRRLSPAGRRLRVSRPCRSARRSRTASSRRCGSSTSRSASTSTSSSGRQPIVTAAPHAHPVVQRGPRSGARRYFAAKRESLFELDLYLVVLYEGDVTQPSWSQRLGDFVASPAHALRARLSVRGATTRPGRSADPRRRASAPEGGRLRDPAGRHRAARRCSPKGEAFRFLRRARELHAAQGRTASR